MKGVCTRNMKQATDSTGLTLSHLGYGVPPGRILCHPLDVCSLSGPRRLCFCFLLANSIPARQAAQPVRDTTQYDPPYLGQMKQSLRLPHAVGRAEKKWMHYSDRYQEEIWSTFEMVHHHCGTDRNSGGSAEKKRVQLCGVYLQHSEEWRKRSQPGGRRLPKTLKKSWRMFKARKQKTLMGFWFTNS